jgi:hypothetical protein
VRLLCENGPDDALAQCCAGVHELAEHSLTHLYATARKDKAAGGDVRTTTSGALRLSIPSRTDKVVFRQYALQPRPARVAQPARESAIAHGLGERSGDADAKRKQAGHKRGQKERSADERAGGAVKTYSSISVCAMTRSESSITTALGDWNRWVAARYALRV